MEKTNKIVEKINQIFDIICFIYDETEFNFDSASELIQKLQSALELAKNLDVKDITMEIWDATSKSQREDKIIHLMNFKFDRLLTWKPDAHDISILNKELKKDLDIFLVKQIQIKRDYIAAERVQIDRLYTAIAHRLLKANLDLDKVMRQLMKMQEEEGAGSESEELLTVKSNNIKLHPDKINEFGYVIAGMFENNFFIPVDISIPFSKSEVFNALGELLHSTFEYLPEPFAKPIIVESVINSSNEKTFAEYLLHENRYKLAEAMRKEFSTEKGKAIRLLLYVLETNNPPLITIGYRQAKEVHTSMTNFFERNIGKYQSVFDYKVDAKFDQIDLDKITTRIDHILSTL